MIVVYYGNTCHVFPRHLHHDMTTEDTLQYSKMGRGVLNSMMMVVEAWLLRRSCDSDLGQPWAEHHAAASRLTAPNHQPVLGHAFAEAIPKQQSTCDQHTRQLRCCVYKRHSIAHPACGKP